MMASLQIFLLTYTTTDKQNSVGIITDVEISFIERIFELNIENHFCDDSVSDRVVHVVVALYSQVHNTAFFLSQYRQQGIL